MPLSISSLSVLWEWFPSLLSQSPQTFLFISVKGLYLNFRLYANTLSLPWGGYPHPLLLTVWFPLSLVKLQIAYSLLTFPHLSCDASSLDSLISAALLLCKPLCVYQRFLDWGCTAGPSPLHRRCRSIISFLSQGTLTCVTPLSSRGSWDSYLNFHP